MKLVDFMQGRLSEIHFWVPCGGGGMRVKINCTDTVDIEVDGTDIVEDLSFDEFTRLVQKLNEVVAALDGEVKDLETNLKRDV